MDRVAKRIDWAAVGRAKRAEGARKAAERREFLYGRLFGRPVGNREVAALSSEGEAQQLFSIALNQLDIPLQIAILHVAIDNRWSSVVTAFIKVWDGEHPIARTVQELWTLTQATDRTTV